VRPGSGIFGDWIEAPGAVLSLRNLLRLSLLISDNTATDPLEESGGGSISVYLDCSPVITDNIISGNSCTGEGHGGGIIISNNCSPLIANNIITGNSCIGEGSGGALLIAEDCSFFIDNNKASQLNTMPPVVGELDFGIEFIPWEKVEKHIKMTINVGGLAKRM